VALLPGKAAEEPGTVIERGFSFASGETVKWNFEEDATLCLAEGPNGLVAGLASRIDLPWIKMHSSRPIDISIDKGGKGTLAAPPGCEEATVHLELSGRLPRQFTIAPDSYAGVEQP
jgi:hypothetical protein